MKKTLSFVAVLFLLSVSAFAQTQSGINIRPHFAQQGFNPMNPGAVGHPVITANAMMANALMNQFTVTNYSTKTVTSVEYGWRISAPAACSNSTLSVRWDTARADITVAPGGEAAISTPDSLSRAGTASDLATEARATNTPVVLVTIGIVRATYADGTTWTDDEAVERNTFDNGRAEKEEGCRLPTPKQLQSEAGSRPPF